MYLQKIEKKVLLNDTIMAVCVQNINYCIERKMQINGNRNWHKVSYTLRYEGMLI